MLYTDSDINLLLNQLTKLRYDNTYLVRQWTELNKIATALRNQLASYQRENEGLKAALLQLHQFNRAHYE